MEEDFPTLDVNRQYVRVGVVVYLISSSDVQVRHLMEDLRQLMADRRRLMAQVRQIRIKRKKACQKCSWIQNL
jgi:hypothetical protein